MNEPNVDEVTPVYVPSHGVRSYTMEVIFINGYGKYQSTVGYWHDIDKCWNHESNGMKIDYEIVRTEALKETIKHHLE